MRRTLIKLGEFSLTVACLLLLSASSLAQISLREALDFDGDNKADYLIFRSSNNYWYVQGSYNAGFQYKNFVMSTRDYLTPGDYDGDNKADFSVWRVENGYGYWRRYNSTDNTYHSYQFGVAGDEPVARDYDGDGKTDFAVVRRSPGSCTINGSMVWYVLRSSDNGFVAFQFGYDTDIAAPGDYDGDGKFDFAVQRPGTYPPDNPNCPAIKATKGNASSDFYIYRSSDNILTVMPFGLSSEFVVPGDYDGDGKTDIAVVREGLTSSSNLIWSIKQSSNGVNKNVYFGLSGFDKTAQGDYDGDGKTDPAVWRESDKMFYILRSSNNGLLVIQFGSSGDFPVAGYDAH